MNKWHFALVLLVFIAGNATAATVFERSFAEMGYSELTLEGPLEAECKEIPFIFPEDLNFIAEQNYPIASLHLVLLPILGRDFYVELELNDKNAGIFYTKDFFCEEDCWLRAELPKTLLREGENAIKACLHNSEAVTKSVLRGDSSVGVYHTADFSGEDAFLEEAGREELLIGEKVKITMRLHNRGSASCFVEMKHARALAEDKEAYVVVDGNTQFRGFIRAGETIEVSYEIKPRVLGAISLPPPILYYANEFGEPLQKFGKMVTINVKEIERAVNAFVVKEREINMAGTTTAMRLAVKNEGRDALFNLGIHLVLPEGLSLAEAPASFIDVLQPGETKYLDFSARTLQPGEYKIGCRVTYIDLNESESSCEQTTLVFREPEIPAELLIGLVLVAIALAVYLYIQKTG